MADSDLAFRHCGKPTASPVNGIVKSFRIAPAWLAGTLTRNGPGIQKIGKHSYNHMFDGLAIIHRFHIQDGMVTYNNRPLESDAHRKNMVAERIVVTEFGTASIPDPCDTLFNKFKSLFVSNENMKDGNDLTDNCVVNVSYFGDQLYVLTETNFARQIDPTTLECIGEKTNISKYVAVNLASAHPHILPDGTVLNLGLNFEDIKGSCYLILPPSYGSTDTNFKNVKILAEIPARWRFHPGYYHSIGLTKDRIIFIEQPYCFNVLRLMMINVCPTAITNTLKWDPSKKTRIHVLSMTTGEVHPVIYETEKLFTFHHANAYEEDGQIVVDLSGYDDAMYVNDLALNRTKHPVFTGASLRRYVLPLDVSTAVNPKFNLSLQQLNFNALLFGLVSRREFGDAPRHNSDCKTTKRGKEKWLMSNRKLFKGMDGIATNQLPTKWTQASLYLWSQFNQITQGKRDSRTFLQPDILVKVDCQGGQTLSWVKKGVYCSEPIFVPNTTLENAAEDDGVILSSLIYTDDQFKTSLLILDAKTMEELATVDFTAEGPVTSTFHGQWATTGHKVHLY